MRRRFFIMVKKSSIQLEIEGIQAVTDKLEQVARDLHGPPMLEGMRDATMLVTRQARINAPVDTGRLRASIAPEVRQAGKTVRGVVGSNVRYAAFQEKKKHYLQRAFEENLEKIKTLIRDVVARIVKK